MRREVEAAEAAEAGTTRKKATRKAAGDTAEGTTKKKRAKKGDADGEAPKKKRKAAKPRTKRAKEAMQRRRLIWVVYSSTMREEGRFLYHEKDKADELLATLLGRGKRRYFMQPMKEALNPDGTPVASTGPALAADEVDEDEDVKAKVEVDAEADDDVDLDADLEGDEEADDSETEEAAPEA